MRPSAQRFIGGVASSVRPLLPIAADVEDAERAGANVAPPYQPHHPVEPHQRGAHSEAPQRHVRTFIPQHCRP